MGSVFIAVLCVRFYQAIVRPHLVGNCKFYPTCSDYAVEAFRLHGLARGLSLAVRRICRCHPIGPGGIDPVPPPVEAAASLNPPTPQMGTLKIR
ncbi:MAG: membrane protein insertion efficiency factor YidD [Phycisphaerae bacterium]